MENKDIETPVIVKRKAGRPRKYPDGTKSCKMFGVHLLPEDSERLHLIAKHFGCKRTDAIIRLIREAESKYNQAMASAWGDR